MRHLVLLLMLFFIVFGSNHIKTTVADQSDILSLEEVNYLIDETNFEVNRQCSGTLIDKEKGLIITSWHCVNFTVIGGIKVPNPYPKNVVIVHRKFNGHDLVDEKTYKAEVISKDAEIDLALLKITTEGFVGKAEIKFAAADHKVLRGEKVYAIGNPALLYSTLIIGNVSSTNRKIDLPITKSKQRINAIQYNGGTTGGSSGGLLLDEKGRGLGVVAANIPTADFIGIAISFDVIGNFLKKAGQGHLVNVSSR